MTVYTLLPAKVLTQLPQQGEALRVAHAATTVEAVSRSDVKPRVTGSIESLYAREGDFVKKGQVLARLTAPSTEMEFNRARRDLASLDAQISGASTELAEATSERLRIGKLTASGSVSTAELERARSRLGVLQAQLAGLQVQRKAFGDELKTRTSMSESGIGSKDLEICSPMDGVILRRSVDLGTFTTPAQTTFVVGTLDALAVDAIVDETDIPYITRDTEVWLSFRVVPQLKLRGKVVEIPQDAHRELQAFVVKVAIDGPPPTLRPGMSGEAAFVLERHANARLIPAAALAADRSVRVVRGGKIQTLRPSIGIIGRTEVEVLGGIEPLEHIVVGPERLPADGSRIREQLTPSATVK